MVKSQQSTVHYYEDGDILVTVQHTVFRLHRNFLAMASKVFEDLFSYATTSDINDDNVPCLTLTDTSALAFEDLLTFLYPKKYVRISWGNIGSFLKIGDKYEIIVAIGASEEFLQYFQKLSYKAASSLLSKHLDYILAIGNLSELNIQEYRHNCSYSVTGKYIQKILNDRTKSVKGFPVRMMIDLMIVKKDF
ncbi:hypothetical protein C1645_769262 [Glomus cerebriforme]|uniref:BTB domain-containing protein n=1 Tax=Glomus cerebriforme TaxID=658196 RepID=A0A397SXR3_9GLOM|nr:hypothetical protein C1645_769262 [Glomus cerebriforme]